ncbi:MAG: cbb3-type cytochrome c oxidase subunit I [Planctomycetota bacterium]
MGVEPAVAAHEPRGLWRRSVFSTDHKVIGLQYLVSAMVMALIGGGLAVMMRTQLAWPKEGLFQPAAYISFVTMHGTIMIFFVISAALSGLGNFVIPLQVGARDMAYPFLNMLSFWVFVPACILMVGSFFVPGGAAASGWTAYPPLSAVVLPEEVPGSGAGQTLWLLSMALFIASFTMGGLNFLTTILNCRTRGMSMFRLPLTNWGFLVASVLGILAFPALTAAAVMLLLDRHGGTSFFLPAGMVVGNQPLEDFAGGTPLLFQHLFWFLGHPEVYVLVVPPLCITFDVLAAFTRRPLFGYRISIYSLLVVGVLSMIVWGHHMFVTGMNPYVGEYFSIMTVIITAPFSVLGVNLLLSLWRARMRLEVPMLFALGVISAVGLGGMGGLFLGTMASDIYFHETYFVVGHFHLMIGTVTLLGVLAGTYYWFPKMFGRKMNDTLGRIHFWLTLVPMLSIFVLMHMQGLGGMLRRSYDSTIYAYNVTNASLRVPITAVAFLLFAAQLVFLVNFFWSAARGRKVGRNPWAAATLEWEVDSPPPHGNFGAELPVVRRWAYEYSPPGAAQDFLAQTREDG